MTVSPVDGQLFRMNYLRKLEKLPDSGRARRRIAACFKGNMAYFRGDTFADIVERELGIAIPVIGYDPEAGNHYDHRDFWSNCELGDFLSAITIFLNVAKNNANALAEVRRIFDEEDIHYKIDDKGGVHYLVDKEFDLAVSSTLSGLEAARFTAARNALEEGLNNLSAKRQSGKALIRGVFESVESAYLVVIEEQSDRLSEKSIDKHLKPHLLARYEGVPEAEDKVDRMMATLAKYAKSVHPYRHGAPLEENHEAPLDEAILSASIGMAFLRYLVSD